MVPPSHPCPTTANNSIPPHDGHLSLSHNGNRPLPHRGHQPIPIPPPPSVPVPLWPPVLVPPWPPTCPYPTMATNHCPSSATNSPCPPMAPCSCPMMATHSCPPMATGPSLSHHDHFSLSHHGHQPLSHHGHQSIPVPDLARSSITPSQPTGDVPLPHSLPGPMECSPPTLHSLSQSHPYLKGIPSAQRQWDGRGGGWGQGSVGCVRLPPLHPCNPRRGWGLPMEPPFKWSN